MNSGFDYGPDSKEQKQADFDLHCKALKRGWEVGYYPWYVKECKLDYRRKELIISIIRRGGSQTAKMDKWNMEAYHLEDLRAMVRDGWSVWVCFFDENSKERGKYWLRDCMTGRRGRGYWICPRADREPVV